MSNDISINSDLMLSLINKLKAYGEDKTYHMISSMSAVSMAPSKQTSTGSILYGTILAFRESLVKELHTKGLSVEQIEKTELYLIVNRILDQVNRFDIEIQKIKLESKTETDILADLAGIYLGGILHILREMKVENKNPN